MTERKYNPNDNAEEHCKPSTQRFPAAHTHEIFHFKISSLYDHDEVFVTGNRSAKATNAA